MQGSFILRWRWKKNKNKPHPSPFPCPLLLFITLLTLSTLLLFLLSTHSPLPLPLSKFPQCPRILGERFLFYAPHSGFSNQVSEFKNAILIAGILNRTVVVPPVLDHHAVALGSCPKFRVLGANEIRGKVWESLIELLRTGRYVSLANILDLSTLSSVVQTIDFRNLVSKMCGIDLNLVCSNDSGIQSSLLDALGQCGFLLAGLKGNVDDCFYAVDEDCRTTVWTYDRNENDGSLDSFQPDENIRTRKKISFVRRRSDVYRNLGPGSKAHSATVVAFGSLFTAPYKGSELFIDIHESRGDRRIQSLIEKVEFIPFVPAVTSAGKKYSSRINSPFLCAQLRLLDGQFKNHWKTTFSELRQKLKILEQSGTARPINIFIMTDLPEGNWTGTFLGDLAREHYSYKLHVLQKDDDYVKTIAQEVASLGLDARLRTPSGASVVHQKYDCSDGHLPDLLLYIEETVCACASLGFVGTAGSTIAESIDLMRKNRICSG